MSGRLSRAIRMIPLEKFMIATLRAIFCDQMIIFKVGTAYALCVDQQGNCELPLPVVLLQTGCLQRGSSRGSSQPHP